MTQDVAEGKHAAHAEKKKPAYARVLLLKNIHPGPIACFFLFEGSITFAVLLALLGLVSWWGLLVLPVLIALMVKLNDIVAGVLARKRV